LASTLFGVAPEDAVGATCHTVVRACDAVGTTICEENCRFIRMARRGRPQVPVETQIIDAQGRPHWLELVVIPWTAPDGSGPWLVHWGLPLDFNRNCQNYLQRVARRSPEPLLTLEQVEEKLTDREREILRALADDQSLFSVACRFHLSHATVRNHVQHLLRKLGAHSIPEAVARYLLAGEGDRI